MSLSTNSTDLTLQFAVNTHGPRKTVTWRFSPDEIFYDENRYIQFFSIHYDDGYMGNLILRRKNTSKAQILEFFKTYIAPLGLHIVGKSIQEQYKNNPNLPSINLAIWIAEKHGPGVIEKIIDKVYDPQDYGYYDIATGEYVITHLVKI